MSRGRGGSIGVRAVLVAAGTAVVASAAMTWLGFGWTSRLLAAGARTQAEMVARLAADAAADPIVALDVARLREIVAVARLDGVVTRAVAFDARGRILTDGTVGNPMRHEPFPDAGPALSDGQVHVVRREPGVLRVVAPVRVGEAIRGGVALDVSLEPLARQRARLAVRAGLAAAVLALLLGGAAAWVASRSVARPVERITRAAEAVAEGRPVEIPHGPGPREVQALARAFDVMLERLHRATLSRETLERTLDALGEGLVVVGPEGRIRSASRGVGELRGETGRPPVGSQFEELFVAQDRAAVRGWLAAARDEERGVVHGEGRLVVPDGTSVPVLVTMRAMRRVRGDELEVVCLLRDAREIERRRELQDRFLATVTHELRTPVTAIAGAVSLLEGEIGGGAGEGPSDLLRIAAANCERLARLVDDLMDLERARAGCLGLDVEEVDLAEVIRDEVERMRPFAARRGVGLELAPVRAVRVLADARRLGQALGNLLSNACKFSPRGAVVEVWIRTGGERVRIEVADRGPGVPPTLRPHLFQRFVRANAPARGAGGAGLGLSIVRELVERMGGSVGYRDRDGGGAVFWIELPCP